MTMMLGGVICGYWASGRLNTATAPASVMTMDRTEAKIGRSIKKCENMPLPRKGTPETRRKENQFWIVFGFLGVSVSLSANFFVSMSRSGDAGFLGGSCIL